MKISYEAIKSRIREVKNRLLNQTAIYALRAMAYLASQEEGNPVMSTVIADEMYIPKNFLSKILNRLAQAGFINTIRGRNGGVFLAREANTIHLREIVNLFMRIDDYKMCFLGLNTCDGTCGLHLRWKIISEQFEKMLDDVTIDNIL
jgi:Rrf2 family protein